MFPPLVVQASGPRLSNPRHKGQSSAFRLPESARPQQAVRSTQQDAAFPAAGSASYNCTTFKLLPKMARHLGINCDQLPLCAVEDRPKSTTSLSCNPSAGTWGTAMPNGNRQRGARSGWNRRRNVQPDGTVDDVHGKAQVYCLDDKDQVVCSRELEFTSREHLAHLIELECRRYPVVEAWWGGVCVFRRGARGRLVAEPLASTRCARS